MEEKLSRNVVDSGHSSIRGYLNERELMTAISVGILKYGRLGAVMGVLIALGESVHLWYTGPAVPVVVAVTGLLVGYLKTKYQAEKMLDEGKPILFSEDENDG
jgi:hypothetical protein